ncbi:hypothetical protein [Paenibacillus durus]|uniref:Uncharacterized protein n=1 Tax=Paenibacillus durus TaxID=44251 RepID=A0A089HT95_PAEDU|nr:hypothetical protein [Paenibacillus durus]AIQ15261.1 hypothetical protein PDUR_27925 [Paenibacillus durus]
MQAAYFDHNFWLWMKESPWHMGIIVTLCILLVVSMALVFIEERTPKMKDYTALIRRALDAAGYTHEPATPEALRNCFADYIDAGVWINLELEDMDELTIADMARGLIRLKG